MSSTKHLTLEILDSIIRDYNTKNPGLWPSQSTNKEFRTLSAAILKRLLGLDKLDIPKHVKGLGSYLEWRGFKVSFKSASKRLSIDILDCMILDYNAKNPGQWPTQNTTKEWLVIHSARGCTR
jgi:hypothetical protein